MSRRPNISAVGMEGPIGGAHAPPMPVAGSGRTPDPAFTVR